MNITIEQKKQKALELMKKLDIYKPYIKGFEKDNEVCFFEGFGGFWAYQEPNLWKKSKNLKKNTTVLCMPLRTNTWNLANATTFSIYPTTKKIGISFSSIKATCTLPLLTFGTKTVNGVRNSARLESALLPAALNVLRKGEKYETDRSKSTSQLNGRKDGPGNIARS